MTSTLIGPLTAEEWCSLRLGADDDPLQCCAETSDVRDAVFDTLRMGADAQNDVHLRYVWPIVEQHEGLADHPVMAKLHAHYVAGKPELAPDRALAEMLAVDVAYVDSLLGAVTEVFDVDTEEGRVIALGRMAPKIAHVLDASDRAAAVFRLADVLSMPAWQVARVVDAWRANVGLPVVPGTEPTTQA